MAQKKAEIMHLMILNRCYHQCKLCCNKLYDIDKIPVATVEELKQVHTVCITGGEPFLADIDIDKFAGRIKRQYENVKNIYVYTSGAAILNSIADFWCDGFNFIDGINFAPKSIYDWDGIETLKSKLTTYCLGTIQELRSNRLYVFKEQKEIFEYKYSHLPDVFNMNVIYRKWDKKFNTPDNEIFRRLPIFLG